MKIKLNKNTFLKFIFINLIIINIKSEDNDIENNELFTCPKIKSINEIKPNMLCNELQLLLLYYNNSRKENIQFTATRESMFQKISQMITNTKNDEFKNYISNANEKTKKFFITEEENKKEETNKE